MERGEEQEVITTKSSIVPLSKYPLSTYHVPALLLSQEPASVTQLRAATQQYDVRPAVTEVTVRGEPEGGVVGGAGMRTHHDVGEMAGQLPPVFLVNGCSTREHDETIRMYS